MTKEELREWRQGRRLSRRGLGELLGVSPRTVEGWEQGLRSVPAFLPLALDHLVCLGAITGSTPSEYVTP